MVAENGDADSIANLGHIFKEGLGSTEPDPAKAAMLYGKAVQMGLNRAKGNLADMYREDEGVPQSNAEAERLYRSLAEDGDAIAQYNLFAILQEEERLEESVEWLNASVENGQPEAQEFIQQFQDNFVVLSELGKCFLYGKHVKPNYVKARVLLEQAIACEDGDGYGDALYEIGRIFYNGLGVEINEIHAWHMFVLAAKAGDERAESMIKHMNLIANRRGFGSVYD